MKLSLSTTALLAAAGVAQASTLYRRELLARTGPTCAVDGGMGTCMSTAERCEGGSFHRGNGARAACGNDETVQCCIVGGGGNARTVADALKARAGAGTGTAPKKAASSPPPGSGPLPGLNSVQSAHAWAIVGEVQSAGVGKQGCLAAFATALVESSVYVYANNAVPASLNYPHDKIGSDHDSIGIFQQRASVYPNIAADMDPAQSAGQFFQVMEGISGWQTMDVGTLCQEVQKSAYPTRYSQQVGAATQICSAAGIN